MIELTNVAKLYGEVIGVNDFTRSLAPRASVGGKPDAENNATTRMA